MRSIIVLLLAGASAGVLASPQLVGRQVCTYGPSYWCHNIIQAKQCSAIDNCIESHWNTQQLEADNDGICNLCKDMVTQARAVVASPDTEHEIELVFDHGCRVIPFTDASNQCLKIGSKYIPELLKVIASQMAPQTVCATAGLCNSAKIDHMLAVNNQTMWSAVQTTKDKSPCTDCQNFMADIRDVVAGHSKYELLDRLLAICSSLGSLSDSCSALASLNVDDIYQFLTVELDPSQLCDTLGMCGTLLPMLEQASVQEQSCAVCHASLWRWSQNDSFQQFRHMLEEVCAATGTFALHCRSLVNNYAEAAYAGMRSSSFSSMQSCRSVGMCALERDVVEQPRWNTLRLPLSPGHLTAPAVEVTIAGRTGIVATSDEACVMCEFTLHFIQQQLQKEATRQDIEAAVHKACLYLPNNLREQCDDYVDAYGELVISMLEQEIDPAGLCPRLGLCPGNAVVVHTLQADTPCVLCEFAMERMKQLLEDRSNQEAVRQALDQLCSVMPHVIASQCQTFVDENTVEIIKLIDAGFQPEQVCHQLGLCDTMHQVARLAIEPTQEQLYEELPVPMPQDGSVVNDNWLAQETPEEAVALKVVDESDQLPLARMLGSTYRSATSPRQSQQCVLCEFVMSTLEKMVLDNNTRIESELEEALDHVCLLLPTHLMHDCVGLVGQYTRPIVAMLVSNVNPKLVCRSLGVCSPTLAPTPVAALTPVDEMVPQPARTGRARRSVTLSKEEATRKTNNCVVCKALSKMDRADREAFCATVDVGTTEDCLGLHQSDAVGANCTVAAACDPPTDLLGSSMCTWGPSAWCSTRTHATACGQLAWCKKAGKLP